jgi:hypothetical protein
LKSSADSTGVLALQTSTSGGAATTALTIDTSQNVGIGTTSPYAKIQVYQSSSTLPVDWIYRGTQGTGSSIPTTYGYPYLQIGSSEYASSGVALQTIGFGYVSANGNAPPAEIGLATTNTAGSTYGDLVFATRSVTTATAASERMRINSSGNVGIGVTSPAYKLDLLGGNTPVQIASSDATASIGITLKYNTSTVYGYVGNGSSVLSGAASSDFVMRSEGALAFATNGNTRQATIDTSGNLCVATTQASNMSGGVGLRGVNGSANRNTGVVVSWGASSSGLPQYAGNWPTSAYWGIGYDSGSGGLRLGICSSDSNGWYWTGYAPVYGGAYTNASDYRLKENVIDYNVNALSKIMALRPVMYNIIPKQDDEYEPVIKTEIGFLAHEFQEQVPELVSGKKDGTEADGSPRMQGIDYAKFTAVLTKAIQELNAKVTALEAK